MERRVSGERRLREAGIVTVTVAAGLLGVTAQHVRLLARRKLIRSERIDGRIFLYRESVVAWLATRARK